MRAKAYIWNERNEIVHLRRTRSAENSYTRSKRRYSGLSFREEVRVSLLLAENIFF